MRLSVAIQHHPRRADLLPELAARLAPLDVEVVADPEPEKPTPATWRSYRRALEETPASATHRLVIQDDARPCDRFAELVAGAVEARPDDALVLCVCGEPRETALDLLRAADRREPFLEMTRTRWVPAIAVVWPAELVERILSFVEAQTWPSTFLADDEILFRACRGLGVTPVATVPSLVQHPDLVPSVIGRRFHGAGTIPGRVAALYFDDPGEIDWTYVPPPRIPARSLGR